MYDIKFMSWTTAAKAWGIGSGIPTFVSVDQLRSTADFGKQMDGYEPVSHTFHTTEDGNVHITVLLRREIKAPASTTTL